MGIARGCQRGRGDVAAVDELFGGQEPTTRQALLSRTGPRCRRRRPPCR
jgi:hypothetical protein